MAAEIFNLVGVVVRRGHLDGVRQVQDDLVLRRRAERLEHLLADEHGIVDLRAGEALRRILIADVRAGTGHFLLGQFANELRTLDGDINDALHIGLEHDLALQRRGGVIKMDDNVLRAVDGLERLLDQVRTALHEHLDCHIVGDEIALNQSAADLVLRLRGRRKTNLNLLEANLHERFEEQQLLLEVHRIDERLVAVAQINAAPDRRFRDHLVGPGAVRQGHGGKRNILLTAFVQHRKYLLSLLRDGTKKAPNSRDESSGRMIPSAVPPKFSALCAPSDLSMKVLAYNAASASGPTLPHRTGGSGMSYPR